MLLGMPEIIEGTLKGPTKEKVTVIGISCLYIDLDVGGIYM
jgi:hypothetical protein